MYFIQVFADFIQNINDEKTLYKVLKALKHSFQYQQALAIFNSLQGFEMLEFLLQDRSKIKCDKVYEYCKDIIEEYFYEIHEAL